MNHRVILVDPIQIFQKDLVGMLKELGHIILESTASYENAEELVVTYHPRIVFLTLYGDNPESGLEVLQKIRQLDNRVNLIVCSVKGPNKFTITECKRVNVADFLVMPITLDRLIKALMSIKVYEDRRERGAVVCVGYTPAYEERSLISNLRLVYLCYPSCHLAIQLLQQRRQKRVIILVIQEDLEMYSNAIAKSSEEKEGEPFPPWKKVIFEAQLYYQDYWREAICDSLLPQQVPCLYVPRQEKIPIPLPGDVIDAMNVPFLAASKPYKQVELAVQGEGEEKASVTESVKEIAEEVNERLDDVEREHPELLSDKPEPKAPEEKKPEVKKPKVEKPVVSAAEGRRSSSKRMAHPEVEHKANKDESISSPNEKDEKI